MYDLAIPQNNELELAEAAKELGSNLIFLYPIKTEKELLFVQRKLAELGLKNKIGLLIQLKRQQDLKVKESILRAFDLVVATSQDVELIKEILSDKNVDLFMDIASSTGRDHTHYRRGNFNQVLAKMAKETGKTYAIDFNEILLAEGFKRALLLGRIMQNIDFCEKYQVPILISSFAGDEYALRSSDSLEAFARVLKVRKASSVGEVLEGKARKAREVRPGVRLVN